MLRLKCSICIQAGHVHVVQQAGKNKVTGPGTTPWFFSILKSPYFWKLQPLQYFEVMELKGGKPKCCKTQGFESKSAFRHSAMSIFGRALRSAHFFFLFCCSSVAQLSSLMPYIVRISPEHVGIDICFQARIHFSRCVL